MRLILSLLLLTCSLSAIATEDDQANSWLERLSLSLKELNFSTSFVVVKNNQAEPYHWFHGVSENGSELEIVSLLNGPRRDVLRRGSIVTYIEPERPPYSVASTQISGPIPAIFKENISDLLASYNFISVGRSRVLGRSAQLIRIVSKDQNRYGHWLWLDQETGLLLKFAILTRKGQLLEQVQFTHLDISPVLAEGLKQLEIAELPAVIDLPKSFEEDELTWRVNWLPQGFERKKANRHRIAATKQPVEFMMFSDGLVDVSVYINTSREKQRPMEYVLDGATIALNQVTNGFEVSVVGKIPSTTAQKIADSVVLLAKKTP